MILSAPPQGLLIPTHRPCRGCLILRRAPAGAVILRGVSVILREAYLLRVGSTKLLLHIEHGRRPLLKPVRVGLREQGCVAGAVCFTCNKGNAIKIANMGRHASDISQGSDGSSADSQTALRAH